MSSFKKFLIGFAIALPLVIGLSFMANRLPKIACIWEVDGEIHEGRGEICHNIPEGVDAIVFK